MFKGIDVFMKEYVLTLTETELRIIVNSLSFRPFREVASLIFKIEKQVVGQDSAKPNADMEINDQKLEDGG